MKLFIKKLIFSCVLVVLVAVGASATSRYRLIGLGLLPDGPVSYGQAVNDHGDAIGNAKNSIYFWRSFIWSPKVGMEVLADNFETTVTDINNEKRIIGSIFDYPMGHFIWSKETGMVGLGQDCPGAINNKGEVAGQTTDGKICLWPDPLAYPQEKILFDAIGRANDINDKGEIVGYLDLGGYDTRAWSSRHGILLDQKSSAVAINKQGSIAIQISLSTPEVWNERWEIRDVSGQATASLSGGICAMNNHEEVVGYDENGSFVWERKHGKQTLSQRISPKTGRKWGLTSLTVSGINNEGWIVGSCVNPQARYEAVVLIPVND